MTDDRRCNDPDPLAERAHAAFDGGDLIEARKRFAAAIEAQPDNPVHHRMLGVVCKYLRDWPISLQHSLHALALHGETGDDDRDALRWNAAIAATALGDWATARRQWTDCGIDIPGGDGPIDTNFGVASLRLEPWGRAETVFARRIDPVRAQLIGVPRPDSGYRYGDIVLHDGTSTGQRRFHQSMLPVLNVLQRMRTSEYWSFAVLVACPAREDLEALIETRVPGIAFVDDWTEAIAHDHPPCGDGAPRSHDRDPDTTNDSRWQPQRNIGIAAQSRHSVTRLIDRWKSGNRDRRLSAVESRDAMPCTPPTAGGCWWLPPEDRRRNAGDNPMDRSVD